MPYARLVLPALLFLGAAVATSPPAVAIPGYLDCPPGDGLELNVAGGISCDEAETVAAAYDPAGDKYQDVDDFTCYGAAADVYPIVYTCVHGDQEIVVSEVSPA